MDTQTLSKNLRELTPGDFDWKFALYSTHKGRDGLELDFTSCKMKDISSWVESLIANLLTKTLSDKTVTDYTPFLPKETIGALAQSDERIRDQLRDLFMNIQNALEYAPEDYGAGVIPTSAGYAFYGCKKDEDDKITEEVIFMRRSNPFMSGNKVRLCTTAGGEIIQSEKPLLKFTPVTDFLLVQGVCYFFSAGIEKDFALENRHAAICAKQMARIADAGIVSNYEQLERSAMSAKNTRKFLDFDQNILEHISNLGILERMDFLSTYGITTDNEGRMDTYDPEQCELVIDLLCCRSCVDALGRLSVGSKITPR